MIGLSLSLLLLDVSASLALAWTPSTWHNGPAFRQTTLAGELQIHILANQENEQQQQQSQQQWNIYEASSVTAVTTTTTTTTATDSSTSTTPFLLGVLTAMQDKKLNQIQIKSQSFTSSSIDPALLHVLARCIVQTIPLFHQSVLQLLDDPPILQFTTLQHLFDQSNDTHTTTLNHVDELIELVDLLGNPLAMVPRQIVHQYNLLHRGIGVLVHNHHHTHYYVHQRTAHKRIFPALYDMFCGGISLPGEAPRDTALRELAEELGLNRDNAMSQALCTTIIRTLYNQCVVHIFEYHYDNHNNDDHNREEIQWQPEEVAWGDWCPRATVLLSADLSIARLVELNQWPGTLPRNWEQRSRAITTVTQESEWASWDYVPDGLMVWEAWLEWQSQQQLKQQKPE